MSVRRTASSVTSILTAITLAAPFSHANSDTRGSVDLEWLNGIETSSREILIADDFRVNPDPSYRLAIPEKCQAQGEKELLLLAAQASLEEAFVFIPPLCTWIETGFGETEKAVRLDTSFVVAVLRSYPQVILYHLHPGRSSEVTGYFPAYSDLIGSVLIDAGYFGEPEISIHHRAITSHGLIEYAFIATEKTKRLVAKLQETGLGGHVPQNLAYELARGAHEQSYYDAVEGCARQSAGLVENLTACFPLRTDNFVLRYVEPKN